MNALDEIDHAVRALCAAGCVRDPASGQWMTADHLTLEADPVESAKLLRRLTVQRSIADHHASGRMFTREFVPQARR